jgi:GNAT superfamily N-acetyltransferase
MQNAPAELERVDRLLITAYNAPTRRAELALYLRVQPDGWFVIADGDEIVSVAGAISYRSFCWVGLVATDPGHRGRGLAGRLSAHLVDWAWQQGCKTIALDASDAGRPVYERLGFQVAGFTAELELPALAAGGGGWADGGDGPAARAVTSAAELAAVDLAAFGADRSALLRVLSEDGGRRCYGLPGGDGAAGGLAGYVFAGPGGLGPGCAVDGAAAAALTGAALRDAAAWADPGTRGRVLVPAESAHLPTLLGLGLTERRRLTHMRLGEQVLPGERRRLLAQTSYAAG